MNFKKLMTVQGVPIYYRKMPYVESVSLGILVNVGTRDEIWPQEAGLAHALEHIVFQGTEDFSDSKTLGAYIEDVGGGIDAYTFKEMTFFSIFLAADKVERGIHVLSQMARKPLLREENIKVEMQNIIQEIKRANDDHQQYLFEKANKLIYNSHPLARSELGTEEAVSNFQTKDLRGFMRRYYHPANFTFIAAGNVKAREIKKLFEKYFPEAVSVSANKRERIATIETGKKLFPIPRAVEQCHILIGGLTCGIESADRHPLVLFRAMIDGGLSFPLFQEVRDKRGLAYEVWANCGFCSDAGTFEIYIGADPEKKDEVIKICFDVINANKNSEKLLNRAKEMMLGQMALQGESSEDVLNVAATQLGKTGRISSYEEQVEKIKSITIKQVREVVDKYLSEEKLIKVMLVPEK